MKKINFLIKLKKEGKLQAVKPSEEIKEAYLQRSNESLSSAKTLLKIGNLKDAVALAYYTMYHCLLAALFNIGIKCENHAASIILLKEVFEIDNTNITKAKSERIDKQYYVDFSVNQEEANNAITIAEEFVNQMNNFIATLSLENIKKYNNKAIDLFTEEKKDKKNMKKDKNQENKA